MRILLLIVAALIVLGVVIWSVISIFTAREIVEEQHRE
jgi:hypothetical protein